MLEVVKGLRLHREAALRHLPQEQHAYLGEKRVEVGEWYPEADQMALLHAVAVLFGPPGLDAWRWMGRQRAVQDLRELFSEHLKVGDPAATLRNCELLWPLYRDSGRVETDIADAPPHRIRLLDYPNACAEMVRLFTGYLESALQLSGLSEFEVREPAEWDTECVEWEIHWS